MRMDVPPLLQLNPSWHHPSTNLCLPTVTFIYNRQPSQFPFSHRARFWFKPPSRGNGTFQLRDTFFTSHVGSGKRLKSLCARNSWYMVEPRGSAQDGNTFPPTRPRGEISESSGKNSESSGGTVQAEKMSIFGLGSRRMWQIRRAFNSAKVTLLCLLVTVVVLRGTIGAGKFGTPGQDLAEIREHLIMGRRGEPHRVLTEAASVEDAAKQKQKGTIFVEVDEAEEPEVERDPNGDPYSLGPKISDWDEQRRQWLEKNPAFPSFLPTGRPRILLVTGSAPKPCENPVGDHFLLKSLKNKIDYCRIHDIEIFYNMAHLDWEMSGFWAKLPLIRKLMLAHPEVEFIWWMDSDAMFTDMAFEPPFERYKDHNFVMHGWEELVYNQKKWIGLNTGSFLLRNCQWSLDILDAWAPMGPKGKIRDRAGQLLTGFLTDRPVFEADDQSAMVYLLIKEREKWGDKVYLESAYYLHGYFDILVDKYEEMMEKYHPGLGDHRWPLVTHFVGCKPCGKIGDYPVEKCFREMQRAYNFGDNQILQIYGFTHKSLSSRRVQRTRNETDKPLEVKDELGLLHPPFKALKVSTNSS